MAYSDTGRLRDENARAMPDRPFTMGLDGFRPDRYDIAGALICLVGVGVIMYAPR